MWYAVDLWEEYISRDIYKVWVYVLYGYWRTRLSLDFGEIVLAKRTSFFLIFGDICIRWEGWFFLQDLWI
jgi:hypothetical protein